MFDRYTRHGDTYVDIKQQPNDAADAARLYGEIRRRAEAEAVKAIIERTGAHNEIAFARIDSWISHATDETMVWLLFSINGRPYEIRTAVSRARPEVAEAIGDAIAAKVVRAVLSGRDDGRRVSTVRYE